jgi:hypothetical protein
VFDNAIDNADDAYITTHTCLSSIALAKEDESWDDVERFCRDYDGTPVI